VNIIQILSRKDLLEKHSYSHIGHQKEFKDDMSSNAIEEEPSHLEANPIFSSSIPTLDVLSKPISQPILDLDDLSYSLPPKSYDDPRHSLRQPKYRNHEDHKDDQEEPRTYEEHICRC
jgi:hypothetical protein